MRLRAASEVCVMRRISHHLSCVHLLLLGALLPIAGCIEKQTTHAKQSPNAPSHSASPAQREAGAAPLALKPAPKSDDPLDQLSSRLNGTEPTNDHPLESALKEKRDKPPVDERKAPPAPNTLVNCPQGTVVAGKAPPEGTSQWCERPAAIGSGDREGPYVRWDRNGNKVLEMNFHKGKPNGAMRTFYPTGQPAELKTFRDGVLDGPWTRWDKSGLKLAEGIYGNGKKNGQFSYWGKDNVLLAQGSFREDIRNGVWNRYYATGELRSRMTYREGQKEGLSEEYYATGKLSARGNYHLNKSDGPWTLFYPSGQKKAEGSFSNGRRSGVWTKFRPDGRPNQQRDLGSRDALGGRNDPRPPTAGGPPKDKAGFVEM